MSELCMTVRHSGEGHATTAGSPTGGTLTFDGEGGSFGATPMQHLLAALGACMLMDVAIILRKKRIGFQDLRVNAVGVRPDEGHPKPFTAIRLEFHVEGDVPAKAFDDAVKLSFERYCNVGATLRAGVIPSVSATVHPRAAADASPIARPTG